MLPSISSVGTECQMVVPVRICSLPLPKTGSGWWRIPVNHRPPSNAFEWKRLVHGTQMHSLYCFLYHDRVRALKGSTEADQPSGGAEHIRCFAWETQDKHNAAFYSSLIELFNDGWFYAVKLELLCPWGALKRRHSFARNGQHTAPSNKVIIDAIHVQIIERSQIDSSKGVFFYWDPYHEANPLAGPWIEGYG